VAKSSREPASLLIVFLDLTRFSFQSKQLGDAEVADTVDAFYQLVASAVATAGGKTVKFIGDAALVVFPEGAADTGVRMVLDLKPTVDRFMFERGWECRLEAKIHFGQVIAGEFGPAGDRRFDVIGRNVNATAMLPSNGITLSAHAFGKLSSELRTRVQTYSPKINVRPD
jgi:class 3 adenylate cyclase